MGWITALVLAAGCVDGAVEASSTAVVFGHDGRHEPHDSRSALHAEIARSRVAVRIVDWGVDRSDPEVPVITYPRTLGESEDLCEGERFAEQIAPASCSGTLVDDRVLLTAAHCLSADECDGSHLWVFGFYVSEDGRLAELDADDVYGCTRIIASSERDDFALVELDRIVAGRPPIDVRLISEGLPLGTPLTLIGSPSGIPIKIDSTGAVTYSVPGNYFRATVDAFESNSGSGVFDEDGHLVGILQRGHPDYVERGGCSVVNVLDESDSGEIVGYLDRAMEAYCEVTPDSHQCACDGPCAIEPAMDAAVVDAAVMDAAGVDAAVIDAAGADSGVLDDAGAIGDPPHDGGGCNVGPTRCSSGSLLAVLMLWRRRRFRSGSRVMRRF